MVKKERENLYQVQMCTKPVFCLLFSDPQSIDFLYPLKSFRYPKQVGFSYKPNSISFTLKHRPLHNHSNLQYLQGNLTEWKSCILEGVFYNYYSMSKTSNNNLTFRAEEAVSLLSVLLNPLGKEIQPKMHLVLLT